MRSLFFFILCAVQGFAQTCRPDSPVAADFPATQQTLEALFRQHRPRYTEAEFAATRQQIEQCNAATDRELDGLLSQMSNGSLKYQQVLAYKDVGGLEKQLRDLEESRKKSRSELEQNLGYVKHTGIFAVLLENIDPYEDKSTLIGRANAAIAPVAVEDLVGTYLNRAAAVHDFTPVRDVVQAFVGGEAKAEKEYFNQPNFQKNYFLYVAKVGATPLKQRPSGPANQDQILVFNLAQDSDFRSRLRSKGVSEEHIARIERDVLPYLADVQRDNSTADSRQDDILQRGTEEIRRIERELEDARQRLNTRSTKIAALCKEIGVAFDAKNIDASVNAALQALRRQIQTHTANWTQTKEREFALKETRLFLEGSPAEVLAREALNTCKQLEEGYGKVDRILQITEVENLEVSRYDANRTLTVYRSPQRLWAFPIPLADGSFRLAIVLQFKVTGQKDPSDANKPSSRPAAPTWARQFDFEPNMVWVEGGRFTMGCTQEQGSDCSDSEKPSHAVTLASYYISAHEVTQAQWKAIMGTNPSGHANCDQCPVENVSWEEVQTYLQKLNAKTGKRYRLPTEAEWEFAARGGTKSKGNKYAGEQDMDAVGWYGSNWGSMTHPVGQKTPNELGLYDMSGNVWEWCGDWYGDYTSAAQTNPTGAENGSYRVNRGGSWVNHARDCRVSNRILNSPEFRYVNLGFRLASSPQ